MGKSKKLMSKNDFIMAVLIILITCVVVLMGYRTWLVATMSMSGEFDCRFEEIEYVMLQNDGVCIMPFVTGNISVCGLPKNIHCKGGFEQLPVVRFLAEVTNG